MSNLSNILPQTPDQKRHTQDTIAVAEKPIKELIFAYFKLFEKSAGPKFKRYREIAETINDFRELPAAFADPHALAYAPNTQPCPAEEVLVSPASSTNTLELWEMWELRPSLVPHDMAWDADKKISSLTKLEAMRINAVIGKLLHVVQLSWQIIVNRHSETKNWKLHLHSDNLTLSLIDPSPLTKTDHLKTRLGIVIIVKDKIEINKTINERPAEEHGSIEGKN